ncbi:scavenger receptor class A member 5-like [Lacerta agilis]|uniref:scavenger receptor class A member 5-like n=1 Tax=Lacerta agilis TaxID=80427 RepID=UPI001419AD88|nr:scavenger receptor class A member 5-like [Lacerta agilis]
MENKAMYLHTFGERENGSVFEEQFDGKNLSKLNLCDDGPGSRKRPSGPCGHLGSLAALKYAVVGLYLLVFLILVGVFILAEMHDRRARCTSDGYIFIPPTEAGMPPNASSQEK